MKRAGRSPSCSGSYYTIGFTQKTAAEFFGLLRTTGIQRLVDVRLNRDSQLAGFAKAQDLPFFLRELCGAEYLHEPHTCVVLSLRKESLGPSTRLQPDTA